VVEVSGPILLSGSPSAAAALSLAIMVAIGARVVKINSEKTSTGYPQSDGPVVAAGPFDKLGRTAVCHPLISAPPSRTYTTACFRDADHDGSIALRTPSAQSRLERTREYCTKLRVLSPGAAACCRRYLQQPCRGSAS
jgi:hypothetical protein